MVTGDAVDVSLCEGLAERAVQGDPGAQSELVERLWPWCLRVVRSSKSMAALARSEDHVREVAARLAEKLSKQGAHALRLFPLWKDKHPSSDFGDWMRIVVANVIRDYVREQIGNTRLHEGELSPKRLLNELTLSAAVETAGFRSRPEPPSERDAFPLPPSPRIVASPKLGGAERRRGCCS
jgi:hypothetical protein